MRDLVDEELDAVAGGHWIPTSNPDSTDLDAWPDEIDAEFAPTPPSGGGGIMDAHPTFFNTDINSAITMAQLAGLQGHYIIVPGHAQGPAGTIVVNPVLVYVPYTSDQSFISNLGGESHSIGFSDTATTTFVDDVQHNSTAAVRDGLLSFVHWLADAANTWATTVPEPLKDSFKDFATVINGLEVLAVIADNTHVLTRGDLDHMMGQIAEVAAVKGVDFLQFVVADMAELNPPVAAGVWVLAEIGKTGGFYLMDQIGGWDSVGHSIVNAIDASLQPVVPPTSGGGDSGDGLTLNP